MDTVLETDRLTLRRVTPDDLDRVFALDSDPVVMRYILPPRTREQIAQYIADIIVDYDRFPGLGRWITCNRATGEFIGIFMLKPLQETEFVEIGYRMFPAFWGRGYATEAARALVQYGFKQLRLPQIVGITHPENVSSQHVLEKCGLRYQRVIRLGFVDHELRLFSASNPADSSD